MDRAKKLKLNIITTLIYQFASIISGFILPNYFLRYYGSEVNGLVSSITQFLAVISLCECGVGSVVQAALYKPIAENDEVEISKIYKSSTKFHNKIAMLLIAYMIILIFAFPLIINQKFSIVYTAVLIISITISLLAQYYLSISYRLILNAAQLSYIQMSVCTVMVILNTVFSVLLMRFGASIQVVKLMSSILFLLQPLIYRREVHKRYKIDTHIKLNSEPLKQKWNGFAQHVSTVVLENTDVLVLTFFSTLSNVSIYGVYHLVTNGIKLVFTSVIVNTKSLLGDMYTRKETELLDKTFGYVEWLTHTVVTMIYTMAAILIVPFVQVYTKYITDANYLLPVFGALMCLAMAIYTIRLPYSQMVLAAGHFKQTQSSAIIEMLLNLIISILVVAQFGLIGVVIGTIIAVTYRTLYFVWYLSRDILNRKLSFFFRQLIVDVIVCVIIIVSTQWISMGEIDYISWAIMAIKVGLISLFDVFIVNLVFSRDNVRWLFSLVKRKRDIL